MNRYHSRLRALEGRLRDSSAGAPCEECGGPRRDGSAVWLLNDGEGLSRCPGCDCLVDPCGQTLGAFREGRLHLTIIELSAPDQLEGPDPPEGVGKELRGEITSSTIPS